MKKLKIKVFFTIFSILSIFSFIILLFNNVREYKREKDEIEKVLDRSIKLNNFKSADLFGPEINFEKRDEIFIDFDVYSFVVDVENNYYGLLNAFSGSDKKTNEAVEYVHRIIKNKNLQDKNISIIFGKYSYSFENNILIVVDNSYQSNRVTTYMFYSLILLVLIEIVVIIITYYLTKWIVKPVIDSFERERRFIGDASHELKTPIAVIMASTDAFMQDKNKKWISNIRSESDRMNKLVTDLLDLNHLEDNSKEFKKEEVNLSKLVESSLLTYESLFFEKKLKFDYKIQDSIFYDINEEKIKELISILIDNAIKYSYEDGSVKVNLYRDKDIYLTVLNKGDEIPLEDRKKIFDRFYKVDKSRNRKSNNYGLGLSIAKKIVELHNGNISVDCSHGTTTFIVKF